MPVNAGDRFGPYEVLGLLGTGGMGEVYRARDSRLHREVALKILPDGAAADSAAALRFEREARAIASASHPNICAIHDVGADAGRRFLVMELLEGETLQNRLLRGPLGIGEVIDYGATIADALRTAHNAGLVHRDLKPGNIFLTTRGSLKILDFGLAKATSSSDVVTRAADDVVTAKGAAVGTAAYMSPEQIRGEPLDGRTDVFSMGLVLFEMATGRRGFNGNTGAAVAAAILNDPPPRPASLREGLPRALEDVILKSLEKDADLRHQTAADVRADLLRLKRNLATTATQASEGTSTRVSPSVLPGPAAPVSASSDAQLLAAIVSRHKGWSAAVAGLTLMAILGVGWAIFARRSRAAPAPAPALNNVQIVPVTLGGDTPLGAISPDGRFVVYSNDGGGIHVREVSSGRDLVELVSAGRFSRVSSLTVTPRSEAVDIVATTGTGKIADVWRVPLFGSSVPKQLLSGVASAIGWSPNGQRMAFVRATGRANGMSLVTADADGANEKVLQTLQPPDVFWGDLGPAGHPPTRPAWSPNGQTLAMPVALLNEPSRPSELMLVDAATGAAQTTPLPGMWNEVGWLDDNQLLLVGNDGIEALQWWLWVRNTESGEKRRLIRDFGAIGNLTLTADRTAALLKRYWRWSGIWIADANGSNPEVRVPPSNSGASLPFLDGAGGLTYTAFKGDGRVSTFRIPAGTSAPAMLVEETSPPQAASLSDVSSDGQTVVYSGIKPPNPLIRMKIDGSDRAELVPNVKMPRLTPDGKTVIFAPLVGGGVYSVPVAGGRPSKISDDVIRGPVGILVSLDGRRMLLAGDDGRETVCDLPDCTNQRKITVPPSSVGWAPDSDGIAYVDPGNRERILEQPLNGTAAHVIATLEGTEPILEFRWSPDGSRLAVSRGHHLSDLILVKGLR